MEGSSPAGQPYALVADDEALIRMDAGFILEEAGFGVLEAAHADAALVLLREHAADVALLFTDVDMPPGTMDGFALARETARSWPHISILVASGRMQPKLGDMPDGAHFVGKPFSAAIVVERLKVLLPDGRKPAPLRN